MKQAGQVLEPAVRTREHGGWHGAHAHWSPPTARGALTLEPGIIPWEEIAGCLCEVAHRCLTKVCVCVKQSNRIDRKTVEKARVGSEQCYK